MHYICDVFQWMWCPMSVLLFKFHVMCSVVKAWKAERECMHTCIYWEGFIEIKYFVYSIFCHVFIFLTCWWVFYFFKCHNQGCLNNPVYSNLGICTACWAHFMCYHKLWPTSVSHPSAFLNSSVGLAGAKHCKYRLSLFLALSCKILLFKVTFLILCVILIIFPYFLLVGSLL